MPTPTAALQVKMLSKIPNLRGWAARLLLQFVRRFAWKEFSDAVLEVTMHQPRIFGNPSRLAIHPSAQVNDALFNLNSGTITIANEVFFGHGVSLITGRHNPEATGRVRQIDYPQSGCDIVIEQGAWIASNVTVLGPCRIGENAVVGAHSLVLKDVPANTIVAGVPARVLRGLADAKAERTSTLERQTPRSDAR